jgi:hypothetical protein
MWQDEHSAFHIAAGSPADDGFPVCAAAARTKTDSKAPHAALTVLEPIGVPCYLTDRMYAMKLPFSWAVQARSRTS